VHVIEGDDGIARCWWGAGDEAYRSYHDTEWGFPQGDDRRLFEKICLEGFQSGLAWITILRKRENFRAAFAGFDPEKVASFGEPDVARMLDDAGIVRHQGKIRSAIDNAGRALDLIEEEGLDHIIARHHYLAEGVRAAATEGWGLKLCAKEAKWHSDTVSAIMVPEGFDGAHVIDVAFRRYNLALGAGLSKVAGKLFRIGHLGDLNVTMLAGTLVAVELGLRACQIGVRDSGVRAAMSQLEADFADG